jgi:ABC-2 type transport system permease protein
VKATRLLAMIGRFAHDRSAWWALAVAASALMLVEVNVLGARSYQRWDFSAGEQFSPSAASRSLLSRLETPVEVVVLLPLAHPLRVEVRHMLEAFQALSQRLSVRYVDPDRDAAEYLALAKEQERAAKNPSETGSMPEAALLVRQNERSWFVSTSELYGVDAEGQRYSRIEPALGEAILRVQSSERLTVCFVTGHGEKSIDDGADDGLSELGKILDVKNLEARRTPLDVPRPDLALRDCAVIALVGPKAPVPGEHEKALLAAAEQGASFLLLLDPIVDARGALAGSGLEALTVRFGVTLARGFVLERKPEQRLPQGIGEAFLAEIVPHPVTSGLSSEDLRVDRRVLLVAAQPLELAPGGTAVPLLLASAEAVVLDRLGGESDRSEAAGGKRPLVAAAARSQSSSGRELRAVIVGASNPADSHAFRDPALVGNRAFVEQALGWVASRPLAVGIPEGQPLPAGLALTEESLGDVLRYVLLYMPGAAFFIGVWLLWRRRKAEARFRREPAAAENT